MNPCLILTHNNLELTKRCVESIRNQDIETRVLIVDNGSSDGTAIWAQANGCWLNRSDHNEGVSAGWNHGIACCLQSFDHVLCVGNDTWLPPAFYRTLLSVERPFVTGVAVGSMEQATQPATVFPLTPNPDFSAFLIRRECWEKVGTFDENMRLYASDTDYHVRAHRLGVPLLKACVPYFHERSSTLRLAPEQERQQIQSQANVDRAFFYQRYGCLPGTKEYEALFL